MNIKLSKKVINDFHISLSFTVLFTAFNAQSHILKTITISIQQDKPEYNADGYVCFGIIYTTASLGMCFSPSLMAMIGWKPTMVTGSFCYLTFVTLYYFEISWLMYVGSAITGFGTALLWTCQATYIVLNSEIGSVYNGIGLFWMFFQASYFTGNSFVYYLFKDPNQPIDAAMRKKIAMVLGSFILCSVLMICTLGQPIRQKQNDKMKITALGEMKQSIRVIKTKTMLLSNFIFSCLGLNTTFFSVLAASLGFTKYLSDNSKEYAPLSGVTQGIGEIMGCFFATYLKQKTLFKLKLIPIACILITIAYAICCIGLPNSAVFTYTDESPLIKMPVHYFLAASLLLGFGDACLHIEAYNNIGYLYPNNCAPAFAVFKFVRYVSMATSFYYSNYLGLRIQTIILTTSTLLAFITYYYSWNRIIKSQNADNNMESVSEKECKNNV